MATAYSADGTEITTGEPTGEVEETANVETRQEAPKSNPEWDSVWSDLQGTDIPDTFMDRVKERLTPHLKKNDERYQEVTNKYAQYKPLVENNVSMDQINQAWGVAQQIQENPADFYTRLGAALKERGLTPAEVKEVIEEHKDSVENEDDDDKPYVDPVLKAKIEKLEEAENQRAQLAEVSRIEKTINDGFAAVVKEHEKNASIGHIPITIDHLQPFLMLQANEPGDYDMKKAYQQYADMVQSAIAFPRNRPPSVTPGGTQSLPLNRESGVDAKALNEMTKDQRVAHVTSLFQPKS